MQKECAYFTEKLADAADVHIGLELIHLFILDLLGRSTPAAKIFLNKASSEFRHVAVMPKGLKVFAWICVVLLNAFFVYFAMLKGMQREESWQRGFLLACIAQILIEVFRLHAIMSSNHLFDFVLALDILLRNNGMRVRKLYYSQCDLRRSKSGTVQCALNYRSTEC